MLFKAFFIFVLCNVYFVTLGSSAGDSGEFVSAVLNTNSRNSNTFSFAGKQYYVQTVFKANFYKAVQFCRQQQMQLVTINSQQESERIQKFIIDNGVRRGYFWTSGTNLVGDNEWVWLSSGLNIRYTNWHQQEPSGKSFYNVSENCIELRPVVQYAEKSWNDRECSAELYFICESLPNCPVDIPDGGKL